MTLTMNTAEREAFLPGCTSASSAWTTPAGGRSPFRSGTPTPRAGRSTSSPDGQSIKAQRLRAAGRFSLCAQAETMPYRYVSVEGPITAIDEAVAPDERRAMAVRYLGTEGGELYLAATAAGAAGSVAFRMAPERWRTVGLRETVRLDVAARRTGRSRRRHETLVGGVDPRPGGVGSLGDRQCSPGRCSTPLAFLSIHL